MLIKRLLVPSIFRRSMLLLAVCLLIDSSLTSASPSDYAPHGTVTLDGITVPDIGPMPTQVPTPPTNLSYSEKVELGKQLYFDTRLSKNNTVSCAFATTRARGLPMPARFRSARSARQAVDKHQPSITLGSYRSNFGMAAPVHLKSRRSARFIIPWRWRSSIIRSCQKSQKLRPIAGNFTRVWRRGQLAAYRGSDRRL